jgi:putative flippase GtrA
MLYNNKSSNNKKFPHKELANLLDLLYPFFKRFLTLQTYRYLAVGGVCFCINLAVFTCSHSLYVEYNIGFKYFPSYWISLLTAQIFTITVGFYLCFHFVFPYSDLGVGKQFIRYSISNLIATTLSMMNLYVLISVLDQNIHLSYLCSVIFIQTINYYVQMHYSFEK